MGFCGFDLQENHSVLMVKNQEMSPHRYSRRRGRVPFWNILTAFSITVTYSEWEKSRRALYHLGKDIFLSIPAPSNFPVLPWEEKGKKHL